MTTWLHPQRREIAELLLQGYAPREVLEKIDCSQSLITNFSRLLHLRYSTGRSPPLSQPKILSAEEIRQLDQIFGPKDGICQKCGQKVTKLHRHKLNDCYVWFCAICHQRSMWRVIYRKNPNRFRVKARSIRDRFCRAQWRSRKRGIEWTLTLDEYAVIISQPCHYGSDHPVSEVAGGIDRLDHKKGYTPENSVPCCGNHNWIKGKLEGCGFTYPRTVELMFELINKKDGL